MPAKTACRFPLYGSMSKLSLIASYSLHFVCFKQSVPYWTHRAIACQLLDFSNILWRCRVSGGPARSQLLLKTKVERTLQPRRRGLLKGCLSFSVKIPQLCENVGIIFSHALRLSIRDNLLPRKICGYDMAQEIVARANQCKYVKNQGQALLGYDLARLPWLRDLRIGCLYSWSLSFSAR